MQELTEYQIEKVIDQLANTLSEILTSQRYIDKQDLFVKIKVHTAMAIKEQASRSVKIYDKERDFLKREIEFAQGQRLQEIKAKLIEVNKKHKEQRVIYANVKNVVDKISYINALHLLIEQSFGEQEYLRIKKEASILSHQK